MGLVADFFNTIGPRLPISNAPHVCRWVSFASS